MAKKKWSFNAFVEGKNLKGSNKIWDNKKPATH